MNAGTPTSAAPGVSVRGRMRSAIALAIAACADVRCGRLRGGLRPVDDRQPLRRQHDAGEQRGAANGFAPADAPIAVSVFGWWSHGVAHRLRLLISLTA